MTNVCEQGDLVAQLNSHVAAAGGQPDGPASAVPKNHFCLIATSGVTLHTVPAPLPIAVIRQSGAVSDGTLLTAYFMCVIPC